MACEKLIGRKREKAYARKSASEASSRFRRIPSTLAPHVLTSDNPAGSASRTCDRNRRMRYLISVSFGLAVSCFWSCRSTAASPSATQANPAAVVTALVHAFNHLDLDELRSLLAEDATAFLPFATTGARLNGREAIMHAIEPTFTAERDRSSHGAPYLRLSAKDLKIQRIGHDVAIVSFDVGNQQVFSRRTVILQIIDDRWQILHLHASNIRAEPGAG